MWRFLQAVIIGEPPRRPHLVPQTLAGSGIWLLNPSIRQGFFALPLCACCVETGVEKRIFRAFRCCIVVEQPRDEIAGSFGLHESSR
jgi:hypothetical protein